ncbi:MAG: chemotaxis protein CheW [Candidatus Aquicultor sp.]|nr:chemotaxis protein CheW [Candidatus Aquicultor sp.]
MSSMQELEQATSKTTGDQFVTFKLEDEEYGIEILNVHEIIGYQGFAKVPNAPRFIKGVLNLRGAVVPVIDMRLKFNMAEKAYDNSTVIVILEVQERIIGAIVDAVSDVVTLSPEELQDTPDFSSGVRTDFIKGLGRKDEKLIIMLDIERILGEQEFDLHDAA